MSFQAMTWAVGQKAGSAGEKLVLLMLANHCNGHTGQCNPSHRLLAEECEMGLSTLKGHIAKLEARGLLSIERRFQEGVALPNQYRLNLKGVGQELAEVGQILAGGRSDSGRGVGQILATNQEDKPGSEPGIEPIGRGAKRAPSTFAVTDAMKEWALKEVPLVDVNAETGSFIDHEFRTAHTDWAAAWRNWMRRAHKFALLERNRAAISSGSKNAAGKQSRHTGFDAKDYTKGFEDDCDQIAA